jgi:hypothetical protein
MTEKSEAITWGTNGPCKEMPVIPVNKVWDKERITGSSWLRWRGRTWGCWRKTGKKCHRHTGVIVHVLVFSAWLINMLRWCPPTGRLSPTLLNNKNQKGIRTLYRHTVGHTAFPRTNHLPVVDAWLRILWVTGHHDHEHLKWLYYEIKIKTFCR